jgi:DNA-binding MarR family transcriptional regulator
MAASRDRSRIISGSLLDPRVIDPKQELVSYGDKDNAEIEQIVRVLTSIRDWRQAEQRMSEKSRGYMKLNETDMQALRFIIASKNQGEPITPGALAEHLKISTASTTKLLDRLAKAGHIERSPHPTDRRALIITVSDSTHKEVRETVGRTHAHRFEAAARLNSEEREIVIRFLNDLGSVEFSGEA